MISLENVRLKQIITFFDILVSLNTRKLDYLENVYRKNAECFLETKNFLQELELVGEKDGMLTCSRKLLNFLEVFSVQEYKEEIAKRFLVDLIVENKTDLTNRFHTYIDKFDLKDDIFIYLPTKRENLQFSGIRNLLMELGIVSLETKTNQYILDMNFLDKHIETETNLSAKGFKQLQKMREELGYRAEIWVLQDEKKRLANFPDLLIKIQLLSQISVNAGFDILSFEGLFSGNGDPIHRYIEVKAVRKSAPRFYWSVNEIKKAKELKELYWLYLVYYLDSGKFIVDSVERISNPYEIINNNKIWNCQVELYSFSK
jgi:hypothetical protein